jgi:hypothetical protein
MITALISGEHKKKDSTFRLWDCVEYHGKSYDTLIKVVENGHIKQIDMSTFSGTILCEDVEFTFFMGECQNKNWYHLPF